MSSRAVRLGAVKGSSVRAMRVLGVVRSFTIVYRQPFEVVESLSVVRWLRDGVMLYGIVLFFETTAGWAYAAKRRPVPWSFTVLLRAGMGAVFLGLTVGMAAIATTNRQIWQDFCMIWVGALNFTNLCACATLLLILRQARPIRQYVGDDPMQDRLEFIP